MSFVAWAMLFLIVAFFALAFGFVGVSATAAMIANLLFFAFLAVFLALLIASLTRRRRLH